MHSPLTPYRKRNLGLQHSDFAPLGAHVPGIKGSDDTLAMILLSLCALLLLLAFIILPLLPTHRIANARPLPRPTPSPVITQELPSPTATPTPSPTATPTPTPSPTATPTPIIHTLTSQQTQSKTVNATGQGATPGTQATGTVRISNGDTLNSLNAINQKNAIANINTQLQPGEHLVGNAQCSSDVTSDHAAGDHVDTVNVRVDTTCKATAST